MMIIPKIEMTKCYTPTKCRFLNDKHCLYYNLNIDNIINDICTQRGSQKYRGFITYRKYKELKKLLDSISENSGIENQLDHLWQPDTDINDKICENLQDSKEFIVFELNRVKGRIDNLIKEVLKL